MTQRKKERPPNLVGWCMGVIPTRINQKQLHFMFIGAHPDDADIECAGTAIKFIKAGHHKIGGAELAKRRRKESLAVKDLLGLDDYIVFDNQDGYLEASIENRDKVIKLIRNTKPDIIATHRPNDYHSDHRRVAQLVQDAVYLIAVPNICTEVSALDYNPVILYHQDNFEKPYRFLPNIIVDITAEYEQIIAALHLHESQVYEWLPWIEHYSDEVPSADAPQERLEWLKTRWNNPANVDKNRDRLRELTTPEEFEQIKYIEAFEIGEYGGKLDDSNLADFLPFPVYSKF